MLITAYTTQRNVATFNLYVTDVSAATSILRGSIGPMNHAPGDGKVRDCGRNTQLLMQLKVRLSGKHYEGQNNEKDEQDV